MALWLLLFLVLAGFVSFSHSRVHNVSVVRTEARVDPLDGSNDTCLLRTREDNVYLRIRAIRKGGAHLIDYGIVFPGYAADPVTNNATGGYNAHSWQRVFTYHGRTILSLDINYAMLSLHLLTFGVSKLTVALVDEPPGCFGLLSQTHKIEILQRLIMNDFRKLAERTELIGARDRVCRTVIVDEDGYAKFQQECCKVRKSHALRCGHSTDGGWITGLFVLIAVTKVVFFLFGPVLLERWIFSESVSQCNYVVSLRENLSKTILVKKKRNGDAESRVNMKIKKFLRFNRLVREIPSDEVIPVQFRKMHLQVDERELITEKSVPAGLFCFIYHHIFLFDLCRHEPVASCCRASIFGDVCSRFCWLTVMRRSSLGSRARMMMSWGVLMRCIWCIVVMVIIPSPYLIRVVLYYLYEDAEVVVRHRAADMLNLKTPYGYNPLRYLTPTHIVMVALYIAYGVSFALLALSRAVARERYEGIVLGAVRDMRAISRLECVRMLAAHLLWPFERCGLFGVFVAFVYWPLALPMCALVLLCYSLPTLYLSGRIFVSRRPPCLQDDPHAVNAAPRRLRTTLSGGVKSVEGCLLLENISPTSRGGEHHWGWRLSGAPLMSAAATAIICAACLVVMCCILLMYAEVAGFILQMFLLTLTGVVVNAGSAAKYAMLAFWVVTYAMSCYNGSYSKYQLLNSAIFAYIKEKLNDDIRAMTLSSDDRQSNAAFKYFSASDILCRYVSDGSDDEEHTPLQSTLEETQSAVTTGLTPDSIEYKEGHLNWRVRSLVLFVDRYDVPRIPRALFERICSVEAPGCPGPIHKSLLEATRRLMYMLTFLAFVFVVATAFGSSYDVSSTNQMLLTLAGGFLPFVVRFVLQPSQASPDLNTYTFEGKIHHVIRTFSEMWPAYDLAFTRCVSPGGADSTSVVDLVITTADNTDRPHNVIGSVRSTVGHQPAALNSPNSLAPTAGVAACLVEGAMFEMDDAEDVTSDVDDLRMCRLTNAQLSLSRKRRQSESSL